MSNDEIRDLLLTTSNAELILLSEQAILLEAQEIKELIDLHLKL